MNELAALVQSICHERFSFVRSGERTIVKPLVDDTALIDLRSTLRGCWENELSVWECCLEDSPIWEFGREKW